MIEFSDQLSQNNLIITNQSIDFLSTVLFFSKLIFQKQSVIRTFNKMIFKMIKSHLIQFNIISPS